MAAAEDQDLCFLPAMTTDVTLSSPGRKIMIDAKYYRDALQTHTQRGSRTVHSGNLYQLLAYLHGTTKTSDNQTLEGMLVYPVGEQAVDLRFTIDTYTFEFTRLTSLSPGMPSRLIF